MPTLKASAKLHTLFAFPLGNLQQDPALLLLQYYSSNLPLATTPLTCSSLLPHNRCCWLPVRCMSKAKNQGGIYALIPPMAMPPTPGHSRVELFSGLISEQGGIKRLGKSILVKRGLQRVHAPETTSTSRTKSSWTTKKTRQIWPVKIKDKWNESNIQVGYMR